MVRKGQGLPLNTIIIAIIVIVVLVVIILLFSGQMTLFTGTLSVFQCRGLDCDIIPSTLSENALSNNRLAINVPQTIPRGQTIEATIDDPEGIIVDAEIIVIGPTSTIIAVQRRTQTITGNTIIIDEGVGGGKTHKLSYDDTDEVGVYNYEIIGTHPNGTKVVLGRGAFNVYDPDSYSESIKSIMFSPNPAVQGEPVGLMIVLNDRIDIEAGYVLIRQEARQGLNAQDETGEILIEHVPSLSDDTILYGLIDSTRPLSLGEWTIDRDQIKFYTESNEIDDIVLPAQISSLQVLPSYVACTQSSDCSSDRPFCVDFGEGLHCESRCAQYGEGAVNAESCCIGEYFDSREGVCLDPNNPFTFVIVPIWFFEEENVIYLSNANEIIKTMSAKLPIRECANEQSGFKYVIVEDFECINECKLRSASESENELNKIIHDNILSCFSEAFDCAKRNYDGRIDRVLGISPSGWEYDLITNGGNSEEGEKPSYTFFSGYDGIAQLNGRIALSTITPDLSYSTGVALHEIGHTFGLDHLSCSIQHDRFEYLYPSWACAGVNYEDCQPSCLESISESCSVPPYTCSPEEIERCLSDTLFNKNYIMNYCEPSKEFGPAGYDYLKYSSDMHSGLVVCGAT